MTLSPPAPITIKSLPTKGTRRSLPISTTKTSSTEPNMSHITNQSSSLTLDLDRGEDYENENHLQPVQLPPLPLLISSQISSSLPPPPLLPTTPVSMNITQSQLPQLLLHSDRVSLCRVSLSDRFQRTDSFIKSLPKYVAAYVPTVININEKRQKVFFYTETVGSSDDTALDELIWYNVANDVILDLLNQRIRKAKSTGIWKPLIAYMNMIRTIENYSVSMVYGLYYFGKGGLSQNSFNKYIKFDSLAADYLDATKSFSPEIRHQWETYISSTWRAGFENLVERRLTIYKNVGGGSTTADIPSAKMYYANMTVYIEELRGFQVKLREMIENQVSEELTQAQAKQAIAAFVLVLVLGISPIIIVLVKQVTSTIQTYSLNLSSKSMQLKRERRRSDKLLEQMLPAEVIKQLKKNRQVPAENFECVTIYFSDIVSFTKISSTSSPMEVIVMLNSLYKLFDSKIELYDVYKVETIGDAYMVVSGLPLRNANRHAGEICTMALDLIAGVKQFQIPHRPGTPLQIRVGINSGACVAGVVGTKMPRYCLFGDAINVASRMESHGEALKIHVTEHTKQILDELGGYILEPRGQLEVKGKGAMSTFWLLDMEGGLPTKNVELSTPGFFKQAAQAPEFLHELFGSSGSEDGDEILKKILPPIISSSSTPRHPSSILQTSSIAFISSEKKSRIRPI